MTVPRPAGARVEPLVEAVLAGFYGNRAQVGNGPGVRFVVDPTTHAPRLLARVGSAGARALGRHLAGCATRDRVRRVAAAAVVRSGWVPGGRVLRVQDGIGELRAAVTDVVGRTGVGLVFLGPPRANRKPVVALTDPAGAATAFLKLGHDPLTAGLVARERAALAAVAGRLTGRVHVPQPLGHGTWAGFEAALTAPLPLAACADLPHDALLGLVAAIHATGDLDAPPAADLAQLPGSARLAVLAPVVTEVLDARSGLALGAWHGDLHRGNVAWSRDGLPIAWDWERWESGVPLGLDLLHHTLSTWVRAGSPRRAAAERLLREAGAVLEPLGVPADAAPVAAREYLLRIAWRYAQDRQGEAGARAGDVESWAIPALLGSRIGR